MSKPRIKLINSLLRNSKNKIYLEIGVEKGLNFYRVKAKKKIGVDPYFIISPLTKLRHLSNSFFNYKLFQKTSDEFFDHDANAILAKDKIDVAFVDGLHTYEQTFLDIKNCLNYMADDGVIIVHDCLPKNEAAGIKDLEEARKHPTYAGAWNGDVYKSIIHMNAIHDDLEIFVIDTDHGLGVIRKGSNQKLDFDINKLNEIEFSDFDSNKEKYLNLKAASYLQTVISQ